MLYSELSDHAKRQARDAFRAKDIGYDWWGDVYEDAVTVLGYLGFNATKTVPKRRVGTNDEKWVTVPDISFTGFCSQGDGACFRGDWAAARVDASGLMAYAPKDAFLHDLVARITLISLVHTELTFDIHTNDNRYCHARTMEIAGYERDPDGDGGWTVEDEAIENTMTGLMQEAADWIYRQLDAAHDFIESDENVADNITANEYQFTEEGEMV